MIFVNVVSCKWNSLIWFFHDIIEIHKHRTRKLAYNLQLFWNEVSNFATICLALKGSEWSLKLNHGRIAYLRKTVCSSIDNKLKEDRLFACICNWFFLNTKSSTQMYRLSEHWILNWSYHFFFICEAFNTKIYISELSELDFKTNIVICLLIFPWLV